MIFFLFMCVCVYVLPFLVSKNDRNRRGSLVMALWGKSAKGSASTKDGGPGDEGSVAGSITGSIGAASLDSVQEEQNSDDENDDEDDEHAGFLSRRAAAASTRNPFRDNIDRTQSTKNFRGTYVRTCLCKCLCMHISVRACR